MRGKGRTSDGKTREGVCGRGKRTAISAKPMVWEALTHGLGGVNPWFKMPERRSCAVPKAAFSVPLFSFSPCIPLLSLHTPLSMTRNHLKVNGYGLHTNAAHICDRGSAWRKRSPPREAFCKENSMLFMRLKSYRRCSGACQESLREGVRRFLPISDRIGINAKKDILQRLRTIFVAF